MAYGLRTYNPDGSMQLNITDRLTRLAQSNYVSLGPRESTTIYVSGMANNGQWGVLASSPFSIAIGNGYYTVFNADYDFSNAMTLLAFTF